MYKSDCKDMNNIFNLDKDIIDKIYLCIHHLKFKGVINKINSDKCFILNHAENVPIIDLG